MISNHFQAEELRTDLAKCVIGPYHPALPGLCRMTLDLDGEYIVKAALETGFLHRGLEKAIQLHSWQSAIVYADRVDPENAIVGELALCCAVEEIGRFPVPERAKKIRLILLELSRVSSHLLFIAKLARITETETALHYALRDREKALDLFELLTGARFALNYLRYGGVAADVTEGFLERVLEFCELMKGRIKEYNDLLSYHRVFIQRTMGIGVISPEQVLRLGLTGPTARSSGVTLDLRKTEGQPDYSGLDFDVPVGQGESGFKGDAYDRFLVRVRELTQSLRILKQLSENIPSGPHCELVCGRDFSLVRGEAYSRVEGPRGFFGCYVYSAGGGRPARVQFRTPSTHAILGISEFLEGMRLEDMAVFLASLDLSIAEVDR